MFLKTHFLLLALVLATTTVTTGITPGNTLFTNHMWSSPNATFSLAFVPVQPPTTPPSFTAAIVFSGGAPVVWSAGNGAAVDSGGSLQFLRNGALRLVNGSGATVWDSGTAGRGATSATLEESGNLVIWKGTGTLWSSFDHPTDTLLPSQNFTVGKSLTSQSYSFSLLANGNLILRWNNSIVYWTQDLNSSLNVSLDSPVLALSSIGLLQISDTKLNTPVVIAYSSDYAEENIDVLRVLKLDNDGNLRIYGTNKGSIRWTAVLDQCKIYAYCGNYGVCSYNGSSPSCGCPSENFEMVDPNDARKGCRRKVSLNNCQGSLLTLEHTMILTYFLDPASRTLSQDLCRTTCLSNAGACFASTFLSEGSGHCVIKSEDFVSAYQSYLLPSTSYVKVCQSPAPNPLRVREKRSNVPAWVVVVVVFSTLLGLVALEGGLWMWCCRNKTRFGGLPAHYAHLEYASGAPIQFSYKELHKATKGFEEKLGASGFGSVYRGTLVNKTVVAVKQLEGIKQGEKQFKMEVATISSTHHLNLMRLIGFCSEGRHRLLVYEFMKNGSLGDFLSQREQHSEKMLNWGYRYNIALGTARGITYLHEECRDCIVHCDIKPENILLDENYVVKVSDLGLAKLISPKDLKHRTLTNVRGTRGYLAPEWLVNLPLTSKSDVYSYGMVLLEIVSGRRSFELSEETNRKKFSIWAYEEYERGNISGILDKRLVDQEVNMEQVRRAIQASFWCIQEQPSQRPIMSKVLQMLEGVIEIEKPPAPKSMMEGAVSGTSSYSSSNASAFSVVGVSPPGPSSSSSFLTSDVSTFTSRMNTEKPTSSLLQSDPDRNIQHI
ncbi:G-type lectin S-receptor-like serine/threonine-protein kinase At1g34300 [Cajanus cajan]|uniref:Receptor-like serine/threonine-protein kinase n=1 Tax=Cajanus cajan TaxID=3821 RepID=A0A151RXG6_CAJCA|nr:G-type lectin S-receptor-like serine/threonine-protein kinase At1g34300 [Cajanus cajan]KYP47204.1 Putative receptor protein kinase ZmPK1 [Cajanus cajan]